MRQVVLDTETTGLSPKDGHRIIEVGCVEMVNRRLTGNNFHQYINPEREIDAGALQVHGITQEFLEDKPIFSVVAEDLMEYIKGAELIIHNAPFDVGFMDYEFTLLSQDFPTVRQACEVFDTLKFARKKHPGKPNSLDALCKRYQVDNSNRQLHGALLDADILAQVYLLMTGGQSSMFVDEASQQHLQTQAQPVRLNTERGALPIIHANEQELQQHAERLAAIKKASGGACIWED